MGRLRASQVTDAGIGRRARDGVAESQRSRSSPARCSPSSDEARVLWARTSPCWLIPPAPPPSSVGSYQRIPARFDPAVTVWSTTIDCQPPKFRYASLCIVCPGVARRPTVVLGCGMQFHRAAAEVRAEGSRGYSPVVGDGQGRESSSRSCRWNTLRRSGAPSPHRDERDRGTCGRGCRAVGVGRQHRPGLRVDVTYMSL